jgi:hypothetical protein
VRRQRSIWRKKYDQHIVNAGLRDIRFQLSFGQWFGIWAASGHMHERGNKPGQYVMARFGDRGAYRSGNVEIITINQNTVDGRTGKRNTFDSRVRMSRSRSRMLRDPERGPALLERVGAKVRERFRKSGERERHGAAISAGMRRPEVRARMSEWARNRPRNERGFV